MVEAARAKRAEEQEVARATKALADAEALAVKLQKQYIQGKK